MIRIWSGFHVACKLRCLMLKRKKTNRILRIGLQSLADHSRQCSPFLNIVMSRLIGSLCKLMVVACENNDHVATFQKVIFIPCTIHLGRGGKCSFIKVVLILKSGEDIIARCKYEL